MRSAFFAGIEPKTVMRMSGAVQAVRIAERGMDFSVKFKDNADFAAGKSPLEGRCLRNFFIQKQTTLDLGKIGKHPNRARKREI